MSSSLQVLRAFTGVGVIGCLMLLAGCASTGDNSLRRKGQRGLASWYGPQFDGRPTASGERFDMNKVSAAHRTLPFGTVVRVHNLDNGQTLDVRINDRGPFVRGRIIDLSRAAAQEIGMLEAGIARVEIEVLRAPERTADRPTQAQRLANEYWVQLGAYRERRFADQLIDDFRGRYPAIEVYREGPWFRVQIRGFSDRDEAKRVQQSLGRAGQSAFVLEARP